MELVNALISIRSPSLNAINQASKLARILTNKRKTGSIGTVSVLICGNVSRTMILFFMFKCENVPTSYNLMAGVLLEWTGASQ